MAFKSFIDFKEIPINQPGDYVVGYRPGQEEFKIDVGNFVAGVGKTLGAAPLNYFVTLSGNDINDGKSPQTAFRTIKRACAQALYESRSNLPQFLQETFYGQYSTPITIFVSSGTYEEENPIYVPPSVAVIGDNLRTTSVVPKNKYYDIFWVNNRCYVYGFTFRRHLYPSYAIAFPEFKHLFTSPSQITGYEVNDMFSPRMTLARQLALSKEGQTLTPAEIAFKTTTFIFEGKDYFITPEDYINGFTTMDTCTFYRNNIKRPFIVTSPYTQGCSSITKFTTASAKDAGGGMLVDGARAQGYLRSMVTDSYTQFNEGGKGIHITNNGYAQLVSTFTICCTEGVLCENGGTCSINTSNCSFGLTGLAARGYSPTPTLSGTISEGVSGLTTLIKFNNLKGVAFEDKQPYPGQIFTVNNNTSTFYSINSANKIVSDACTVELDERITSFTGLTAGAPVHFYIRSTITASAHTFEYIGTGVELISAVPQRGGIPDTSLEVKESNQGKVFFTGTNQKGDFRIGQDFTIVQSTGTIEGTTFSRSIFSLITPFTLAVEG